MVGKAAHSEAPRSLLRSAAVDDTGRPREFGPSVSSMAGEDRGNGPTRVNRHRTGAPMIARPSPPQATPTLLDTGQDRRGDWLGTRPRADLQSPVRRMPPPEHLLPVVQQLLTGATDLTASRQLGLSPRTYSRRVSELLEYLGVESRFQAGVEAARRGWLPHPRGASDSGGRGMPVPRMHYDVLATADGVLRSG